MKATISYEEEMKRAKQSQRQGIILCVIIIIGVILLPNLSLFQSEADNALRFDAKGFTLSLPGDEALSIFYSQIVRISLVESPDYGSCISGSTENGCRYGTWESDSYGKYLLCINQDFSTAILIQTDTQVLLFNFESPDTTRQLYESISAAANP